jgi:hypothetical protein
MSTDVSAQAAADLAALRATSGTLDPEDLDRLWPALPTVAIPEILGRWRGVALDTGHRAVQQLKEMNWFGKEFVSASDAKPVLRRDGDGNIYSDREAGAGEASLWMVEYRGEVTATMVYDGMAVFDHFKKVDDNTLLGIMNGKDPDFILDGGHHFYFILERV